ncbi:MAG: peptidoglycan recognition protein family protein [Phycisphaeraceae bacterium]|nr:peptidoglycan recognition protein family protein [Phycisphaeraceae bacterium]
MLDQRTLRVLGSLVVGMTLVSAILLALEPDPGYRTNAWSLTALDMSSDTARDEILGVPDGRKWNYIIIHDSRGVTGNAKELDKAWNLQYARQGLPATRGAGYHFVINDREGRSDGEVEIARRWKDQLAGDYIAGEQADKWNREAIGVCLMGDADNRPFSDDQMDATVKLVRLLQQAYDIPRSRVFLHTGRSADSLARFFPAGEFRKQIRE